MAPGKTRSIVCSARNFFQFTMPGPAWWQVRLHSEDGICENAVTQEEFRTMHIIALNFAYLSYYNQVMVSFLLVKEQCQFFLSRCIKGQ